jgi:glucose-1-phosphate adenylyltransferase
MQRNLNRYKIAAWKFDGYINKINSVSDYFELNMDLLKPSVREELFNKYGLIYTKVLDDVPARYGEHACVKNSLIANGCQIDGSVENSILFREVVIGKGTEVKNSVLMSGCSAGENVSLNYVIADKNVLINNNRTLMGYEKHPIYLKKDSIV